MRSAVVGPGSPGWPVGRKTDSERRVFSSVSDDLARELAGSLSREAGLYTAHEMMEALDPNHQSGLALDLLDECERRLRERELADE